MQRNVLGHAIVASVILAFSSPASHGSTTPNPLAHEAGHPDRVTARGVEGWGVKGGLDPDAGLVNQIVFDAYHLL